MDLASEILLARYRERVAMGEISERDEGGRMCHLGKAQALSLERLS
jgi:hypothetical protein